MSHGRSPHDPFETHRTELDSPTRFAFAINPDVSPVLDISIRGLYVGLPGNVYCRPTGLANNVDGTYLGGSHANVLFHGVVGGTILPIRMDAVWATASDQAGAPLHSNTSASMLVGLY